MFVTVDMGQALQLAANSIVIVGGLYALWRFLKRQWQEPVTKDQVKKD